MPWQADLFLQADNYVIRFAKPMKKILLQLCCHLDALSLSLSQTHIISPSSLFHFLSSYSQSPAFALISLLTLSIIPPMFFLLCPLHSVFSFHYFSPLPRSSIPLSPLYVCLSVSLCRSTGVQNCTITLQSFALYLNSFIIQCSKNSSEATFIMTVLFHHVDLIVFSNSAPYKDIALRLFLFDFYLTLCFMQWRRTLNLSHSCYVHNKD